MGHLPNAIREHTLGNIHILRNHEIGDLRPTHPPALKAAGLSHDTKDSDETGSKKSLPGR